MVPYPQMYPWSTSVSHTEIIRVNGENGARAYQLAPNSSVLLLDETAPLVWLAQTDGAGYKSVTPYTITPYQPEPPVDMRSLDERIKKLEEIVNAKSNSNSPKRKDTSSTE